MEVAVFWYRVAWVQKVYERWHLQIGTRNACLDYKILNEKTTQSPKKLVRRAIFQLDNDEEKCENYDLAKYVSWLEFSRIPLKYFIKPLMQRGAEENHLFRTAEHTHTLHTFVQDWFHSAKKDPICSVYIYST